jgi:hypothetical protein
MSGKSGDAKVRVAKMASLSVAWGVVAGVAYLGLIKRGTDLLVNATLWSGPGVTLDSGLIAIAPAQMADQYRSLTSVVLITIPIAIVAIIALGIAARAMPTLALLSFGVLAAALLGLIGAGVLFLGLVATAKNGSQFVVALATIVLIAVLIRLQRFIRHFYQRAPAAASLILAALIVAYLILGSGTNITSIVLVQVDIWLALIAFAIALYAAFAQIRAGQRLHRG